MIFLAIDFHLNAKFSNASHPSISYPYFVNDIAIKQLLFHRFPIFNAWSKFVFFIIFTFSTERFPFFFLRSFSSFVLVIFHFVLRFFFHFLIF